ncbi:MAG: hypothetical protein AAGB01_11085 [Cyanobacteria bacterium P01_F01_bin.42]
MTIVEPSSNAGREVIQDAHIGQFPFSHTWEKGLGDEGVQKVYITPHTVQR